jgi:hypothetical protein
MSPRDGILARRARFVAAALGAIGTGVTACSCALVCLEPALSDTGVADTDAGDTRDATTDTGAQPCLTADTPPDTNFDTAVSDTADTGPMPCLEPPLDSGAD